MSKWHEHKWQDKSAKVYHETAAALTLVLESLNQGQRQKLMKDAAVAELFSHYGVSPDA